MMFCKNYKNENQKELAKDLNDKFKNLINEEVNKINNNNINYSNLPIYIS